MPPSAAPATTTQFFLCCCLASTRLRPKKRDRGPLEWNKSKAKKKVSRTRSGCSGDECGAEAQQPGATGRQRQSEGRFRSRIRSRSKCATIWAVGLWIRTWEVVLYSRAATVLGHGQATEWGPQNPRAPHYRGHVRVLPRDLFWDLENWKNVR
jgi:hypothetical protein